jgi:hypothetical protein
MVPASGIAIRGRAAGGDNANRRPALRRSPGIPVAGRATDRF